MMIKPGQKRKTLYISALEYVYKEKKYVYKTIKKNFYIIDCRKYTNGYYGFHDSTWSIDECSWLFTEKDLDEIKEYGDESLYICHSERPYSKEELQDKIKEHLESKIQRYTNKINNIINEVYKA